MKKILTPIRLDEDFKLKLQMLADHNLETNSDPGSVASLIREALFKTYPALNESLITFNSRLNEKTQKKFKMKVLFNNLK